VPRIQSALLSKAAPLAMSRAAPPELGGPVPLTTLLSVTPSAPPGYGSWSPWRQSGMTGLPVARPQKGKRTCIPSACADACQSRRPRPGATGGRPTSCLVRLTLDISQGSARGRPAAASTACELDPNWRAMASAAAAAVLSCCTRPWDRGLRISNYGSDLERSYGDSNPRPLACHASQATRLPAATPASTC
jgi:hypothetical protein